MPLNELVGDISKHLKKHQMILCSSQFMQSVVWKYSCCQCEKELGFCHL